MNNAGIFIYSVLLYQFKADFTFPSPYSLVVSRRYFELAVFIEIWEGGGSPCRSKSATVSTLVLDLEERNKNHRIVALVIEIYTYLLQNAQILNLTYS